MRIARQITEQTAVESDGEGEVDGGGADKQRGNMGRIRRAQRESHVALSWTGSLGAFS